MSTVVESIPMKSILIYFYLTSKSWEDMYNKIKDKHPITKEELDEFFMENEIDENNYITIIDNNYPEEYKHQLKPPFVIEIIN